MSSPRQLVVITGASVGIGAALAERFAAGGYDLLLVARSQDKLANLAADLHQKHRVKVTFLSLDLAQAKDRDALIAHINNEGLQVDILINNVGRGVFGHYWKTEWPEEEELLQLNIHCPAQLTHHLLPSMVARRRGHIVNVGSMAGFQPGPLMPLYYASKSFLLSFSHALAEQLGGTGVGVSLIAPGPVHSTEFASRTGAQAKKPVPGSLSPQRVAEAAFRAVNKKQVLVVPGQLNYLATLLPRLVPTKLAAKIVKKGQERLR